MINFTSPSCVVPFVWPDVTSWGDLLCVCVVCVCLVFCGAAVLHPLPTGEHGAKLEAVVAAVLAAQRQDVAAKCLIFSQVARSAGDGNLWRSYSKTWGFRDAVDPVPVRRWG